MRKRFFLNIFLMIVFVFMSYSLIADDDICGPPPPPSGIPSPGGDAADENYSVSNIMAGFSATGIGRGTGSIFYRGHWNSAEKLMSNFYGNINIVDITGDFKPEIVIIPSGGLFGKENDSTLKHVLEQYVSAGGTIVVFCQQYGSHVENVVPIPEGESLKVYGWREYQRV